jgi:hypothetical protein
MTLAYSAGGLAQCCVHQSIVGSNVIQGAAGAVAGKTATASALAANSGTTHIVALRPAGLTCTVTVQLLQNAVSLGTNTQSITSPTITGFGVTISHAAVAFVAGDKLKVKVTQPVSAACAVKVHYDGAAPISQLVHPQ